MSNYPPGVSGNEYEIAGPDYEQETGLLCRAPLRCKGIEIAPGEFSGCVCFGPHEINCPQDCPVCEGTHEITCSGHLIEQGYRGQRWMVCSKCGYRVDLPSLEESRYDADPRV